MDNYPEIQQFITFLLRTSNSIEFFIAGFILYRLRKYVVGTSIFNVIRNISLSLMFLGVIRELASFYDYLFLDNNGTYTLLVNTIVYAYIISVLYKVNKVVSKTDYSQIQFNNVIDRMISDINMAIQKSENKIKQL